VELFGLSGVPSALDEQKVQHILEMLPPRHRMAVRLRFGFDGPPLSFARVGRRLPRACGMGKGVSDETARLLVRDALKRLRSPGCRRRWQQVRKEKNSGEANRRTNA
jgi:DNA-directed RNA polymerase sigma subunit (sigma70/sigma32)